MRVSECWRVYTHAVERIASGNHNMDEDPIDGKKGEFFLLVDDGKRAV